MNLKNSLLLFVLPFVLSACASTKTTNFYLLQPVPTANVEYQNSSSAGKKIIVSMKEVNLPDYLDRPQMVIRENDYKLQFSEYHRWAEPLKDDFTRVLIENINIRLAQDNALIFSNRDEVKTDNQLFIDVVQMDVNKVNQAVLKVKWNLRTEKEEEMGSQYNEYTLPISNSSYEAGVDAQSQAIAQFSEHIAQAIRILNP